MSNNTKIEWTDATWTPIRARRRDTGKVGVHCERVSPACTNCYAATLNRRNLPAHGTGLDFTVPNRDLVEIFVDGRMLLQPLKWKQPRKIFVCSQTDLFADFVSEEMICRVFAIAALCPQHTFQVLTKRPARMRAYLTDECTPTRIMNTMWNVANVDARALKWPLPNVWLGVTTEDQQRADERIPLLLQTPAAVRFISAEPLLGPIELRGVQWNQPNNRNRVDVLRGGLWHPIHGFINASDMQTLNWVITGGESGPNARPSHPDWFRSVRDQCQAAGVAYFHKQNGEWTPGELVPDDRTYETCHWFDGRWDKCEDDWMTEEDHGPILYRVGKKAAGRLLDGVEWNEFPVRIARGE